MEGWPGGSVEHLPEPQREGSVSCGGHRIMGGLVQAESMQQAVAEASSGKKGGDEEVEAVQKPARPRLECEQWGWGMGSVWGCRFS